MNQNQNFVNGNNSSGWNDPPRNVFDRRNQHSSNVNTFNYRDRIRCSPEPATNQGVRNAQDQNLFHNQGNMMPSNQQIGMNVNTNQCMLDRSVTYLQNSFNADPRNPYSISQTLNTNNGYIINNNQQNQVLAPNMVEMAQSMPIINRNHSFNATSNEKGLQNVLPSHMNNKSPDINGINNLSRSSYVNMMHNSSNPNVAAANIQKLSETQNFNVGPDGIFFPQNCSNMGQISSCGNYSVNQQYSDIYNPIYNSNMAIQNYTGEQNNTSNIAVQQNVLSQNANISNNNYQVRAEVPNIHNHNYQGSGVNNNNGFIQTPRLQQHPPVYQFSHQPQMFNNNGSKYSHVQNINNQGFTDTQPYSSDVNMKFHQNNDPIVHKNISHQINHNDMQLLMNNVSAVQQCTSAILLPNSNTNHTFNSEYHKNGLNKPIQNFNSGSTINMQHQSNEHVPGNILKDETKFTNLQNITVAESDTTSNIPQLQGQTTLNGNDSNKANIRNIYQILSGEIPYITSSDVEIVNLYTDFVNKYQSVYNGDISILQNYLSELLKYLENNTQDIILRFDLILAYKIMCIKNDVQLKLYKEGLYLKYADQLWSNLLCLDQYY